MNKTFRDLEKPSSFPLTQHSQNSISNILLLPARSCLSQDHPTTLHPYPTPNALSGIQSSPNALSRIQSSHGIQPQRTHPIPLMTKPYSPSLSFGPLWEDSATSSSSSGVKKKTRTLTGWRKPCLAILLLKVFMASVFIILK